MAIEYFLAFKGDRWVGWIRRNGRKTQYRGLRLNGRWYNRPQFQYDDLEPVPEDRVSKDVRSSRVVIAKRRGGL